MKATLHKIIVGLLVLLAGLVAAAGSGVAPVHAQGAPPLDLAVEVKATTVWEVVASNNSDVDAYDVRVEVRLDPAVRIIDSFRSGIKVGAGVNAGSAVWVIGDLPANTSTSVSFQHDKRQLGLVGLQRAAVKAEATITNSAPVEHEINLRNNTHQAWMTQPGSDRPPEATAADISVALRIDRRFPKQDDTVTFTARVENEIASVPGSRRNQDFTLYEVRARVSLSPGLTLVRATPPAVTTFDAGSGIWELGTIKEDSADRVKTMPVVAIWTGDRPLEESCVALEIAHVRPSEMYRVGRVELKDNSTTVCLGDVPTALVDEGIMDAFFWYPCVGVSAYPCTSGDTLELVSVAYLTELLRYGVEHIYANADRIAGRTYELLTGEQISRGLVILQPEEMVVHLSDQETRQTNSQGTPYWSTFAGESLVLVDSQEILGDGGDWSDAISGMTVTGTGNQPKPGRVVYRLGVDDHDDLGVGDILLDLDNVDTQETDPFDTGYETAVIMEFWALGTYLVDYTAKATHSTKGQLSDTGTYTFHVGPVAELAVRDAGPNPAIDAGQHAYTITALNNGPDATPVEVRLTPWRIPEPSITHAIPSEGTYRDGVWTIDELQTREYRRAGGQSEGPTLTVFAESDVPFWADIAAAREYTVCIGSDGNDIAAANQSACEANSGASWHTGNYYDHRPENNQADIHPWPGTGEGHPDAPAGLTAVDTPAGNILQWEPVVWLNGERVTHYQVQELLERGWWNVADDVTGTTYLDEDFATGHPQYRVRAVNWMGVAGPWSKPTPGQEGESVQAADPVQPPDPATGLTARPGDGYVDLEWRVHRSDGREIFWQLWRSDDQTWWDVFPRAVGSSRLGYTVTGLENGTEYIFRVRAATPNEYGDLVPGVSSGPVLATPTVPAAPPPGHTPPSGPNTPPEFDRDTAWADYCVNGGTGSGREVARVTAFDQDGDRLTFYQVKGFDEIGDQHFTVSNATVGDTYWGVIRTSRSIPRNLEPEDGIISIDLEVNDGRGGVDQIGVSLQYDSSGGNCQGSSSRSTGSGERGSSVTATVKAWAGGVRNWWAGFWAWADWGSRSLASRP